MHEPPKTTYDVKIYEALLIFFVTAVIYKLIVLQFKNQYPDFTMKHRSTLPGQLLVLPALKLGGIYEIRFSILLN